MDAIVKLIGDRKITFDKCKINMESARIFSEKDSTSPSEVIFADLVHKRLVQKIPVALKVFVDLEDFKIKKLKKLYNEEEYDELLDTYNDNIDSIRGLKYEKSMYKKIYKLMVKGICPNFIPYIGYAKCTKKSVLKSLADAHIPPEEFLDNIIFGYLDVNLPINIIITGRPENNVTFSVFLKDINISSNDKILVVLQCLYALYVLREEKIRHNDLHFNNILIAKYENPVEWLFIAGPDKNQWFYVKTQFVPLIFDWDMSYISSIGKNKKIDGYMCDTYNICSKEDQYFDLYTFLCQIKLNHKTIDDKLYKVATDSAISGADAGGHKCRPFISLKDAQIRSIETILSNDIFQQFIYNNENVSSVFGYPINTKKYNEN
jgi:hypothetical protein